MTDAERSRQYEVKIPFRAVGYMRLKTPWLMPNGLRIEESEGDCLATLSVEAPTANEALQICTSAVNDLLGLLALGGGAFLIIEGDNRRNVRRPNAPYVADGLPPPFEVVGGVLTEAGAEHFDPTGELRRQAKIANMTVKAEVLHNKPVFESRALASRASWSERLEKAIALIHQAQCAAEAPVSLLLSYTALEVLAEDDAHALVGAVLKEPRRREGLTVALRELLRNAGFTDAQTDRLLAQLFGTRAVSQLDTFEAYLAAQNIPLERAELEWARGCRGRFVHAGGLDKSEEFRRRAGDFKGRIVNAVRNELERICPEQGAP